MIENGREIQELTLAVFCSSVLVALVLILEGDFDDGDDRGVVHRSAMGWREGGGKETGWGVL